MLEIQRNRPFTANSRVLKNGKAIAELRFQDGKGQILYNGISYEIASPLSLLPQFYLKQQNKTLFSLWRPRLVSLRFLLTAGDRSANPDTTYELVDPADLEPEKPFQVSLGFLKISADSPEQATHKVVLHQGEAIGKVFWLSPSRRSPQPVVDLPDQVPLLTQLFMAWWMRHLALPSQ